MANKLQSVVDVIVIGFDGFQIDAFWNAKSGHETALNRTAMFIAGSVFTTDDQVATINFDFELGWVEITGGDGSLEGAIGVELEAGEGWRSCLKCLGWVVWLVETEKGGQDVVEVGIL